jgi:hypothetical protein
MLSCLAQGEEEIKVAVCNFRSSTSTSVAEVQAGDHLYILERKGEISSYRALELA